jgi:hypothetical protein
LCESASLIRENIIDLAEFFIKVTGLNFGWHIFFEIINPPIPSDEKGLKELHYFKGDHKRNGDHVCED